jgi:NitT/TauT family transport system substrate-binding protein
MHFLFQLGLQFSRRSVLRHFALAVAAMLTSISCRTNVNANQSNTSTSKPLRLGLSLWVGLMPWQVAQEKGFFRSNNLNVEITWFPILSDQISAFNAGKIDVAGGLVINDLLIGITKGLKTKIILVTDFSSGADAIVVAPSINSIKEISGKSASVEIGTVAHLLFLQALKYAGINEELVPIINQSSDAAITALIAGKTQIAAAYEPFVSQAIKRGKGKVIFSSKDVPGLISDLLVARQEAVEQQPEAIQKLVNVWYQTLNYRNTHLQEVLPIEAKQAGTSVEEYQNLLQGFKWLTPQESLQTLQPGKTTQSLIYSAEEVSNFMVKHKLINQKPSSITKIIDTRFLREYLATQSAEQS